VAQKIKKTKKNVISLIQKLDTMIYELGDRVL